MQMMIDQDAVNVLPLSVRAHATTAVCLVTTSSLSLRGFSSPEEGPAPTASVLLLSGSGLLTALLLLGSAGGLGLSLHLSSLGAVVLAHGLDDG